jgi:hypothetical protein
MYYYLFFLDQGTSYRRICRRYFKKDSFDSKLKGLVPFLIVESDWRANSPSRPSFLLHIQLKSWDSYFV